MWEWYIPFGIAFFSKYLVYINYSWDQNSTQPPVLAVKLGIHNVLRGGLATLCSTCSRLLICSVLVATLVYHNSILPLLLLRGLVHICIVFVV